MMLLYQNRSNETFVIIRAEKPIMHQYNGLMRIMVDKNTLQKQYKLTMPGKAKQQINVIKHQIFLCYE